jgi:large subunit ribosomal protein L6
VSRIGKKPITLPAGVTVTRDGEVIRVKGPKGQLQARITTIVDVAIEANEVNVTRRDDGPQSRSMHGLSRTLIGNMVEGVTEGFTRRLEIVGVGYRAELRGKALLLNLGFSHPIMFVPPSDVTLDVPAPTNIGITGIDKQLVGQVAAKIRSFRPPEPYKGKGIKYQGEQVRRKAGKSAGK